MSQERPRSPVIIDDAPVRPTVPCAWCGAPVEAIVVDGRPMIDLSVRMPQSGGCWACNPSGLGTRPQK